MPGNLSKTINPDLLNERKKCSFDIEELARWWNDGQENLQEKRKIENIFFTDPELMDEIPTSYLSHKELYEDSVRKFLLIVKKLKELQPEKKTNNKMENVANMRFMFSLLGGLLKEGSTLGVHYVMFLPSIVRLGTPEQETEWYDKAADLKILGTYAQTELGHGTFLRGLETTATYDTATKEFVLHSPTLTSYKWWPGGLANSTNYAIVVAQLYIKEKCYGIHHFMVQTRDGETWQPMPGIVVGEIGPKLGGTNYNNGYLGLNKVRIPRKNMLMKNAQVLEDGTYVQAPSSVLNYSSMSFVRSVILKDMGKQLAKACTIATRYSAVRRQSPIDPSKPEPQIMDHVSQQYKLFPNIAKSVVYKLVSDNVWNLYNEVNTELDNGNLERLPELHAILCCLKAATTYESSNSVETLRLACGGHGYMACSNLPLIYAHVTAACTYEGENTVLQLQAARYLIKSWGLSLKGGKLTPTVAYLQDSLKNQYQWDPSITGIIRALQIAAANKVRLAYEHVESRKKSNYSQEVANNLTSLDLVQAAEAHAKVILVQFSYNITKNLSLDMSAPLAKVINQLVELYAVDTCLKSLGDLLRYTSLKEKDVQELQQRLENLLQLIRPNAVGFVDGFDIHDVTLSSALGSYDGNVYERLYAEAQKSPLNKEVVNKSFELYLKPFMKSNL